MQIDVIRTIDFEWQTEFTTRLDLWQRAGSLRLLSRRRIDLPAVGKGEGLMCLLDIRSVEHELLPEVGRIGVSDRRPIS